MLESAIWLVVQLIIIAVVAGLLAWLCDYVASQFPQTAPLTRVGKVVVVVVAVLTAVVLLARMVGV